MIDGLIELCENKIDLYLFTSYLEKKPEVKINRKIFKDLPSGNKTNKFLRFFLEIFLGIKVCFFSLLKKKPDLFVISSPSFFAAIIISIYCIIFKIEYFLEVRDAHPDVMVASSLLKENSIMYRVFNFFGVMMYSNAKKIIVSNKGIYKRLKKYTNSDIEVIYNGFPDRMLELSDNKYSKFTICFHGILATFQDVPSLVKLIGLLKNEKNIDIYVIGYGPKESYLKGLSQSNLNFMGKLSPDKTLEIVSKCHLGISIRTDDPISRDCFPVKIWEYIGASIPSIVVPYSEAGAFLDGNKFGFQFNTGEEIKIANKIKELSNDRNIYNSYVKNIKEKHAVFLRSVTGLEIAESILNVLKGMDENK